MMYAGLDRQTAERSIGNQPKFKEGGAPSKIAHQVSLDKAGDDFTDSVAIGLDL
jgi:hypothetical protein